jgi:hypothetical protein
MFELTSMSNSGSTITITPTGFSLRDTIYPNYYLDNTGYWNTYPYYMHVTEPPKICSDRVHVFPCSHCKKCQCGKLELPKK